MQDDQGLKAALKIPGIYSLFQRLVGVDHARRWVTEQYFRTRPGDKIVDIGCGPGDLLEFLPQPRYVGIDISEEYVREGQRRYGNAAVFLAGTTDDYHNDERVQDADLVICFGVMHHLNDDEAGRLLEFARRNLKPGGRFVGLEPCFLAHQAKLSAWLMARDRGQNVRHEHLWKSLLKSEFPDSSTSVLTGLMRVPYTHIILEGRA